MIEWATAGDTLLRPVHRLIEDARALYVFVLVRCRWIAESEDVLHIAA